MSNPPVEAQASSAVMAKSLDCVTLDFSGIAAFATGASR